MAGSTILAAQGAAVGRLRGFCAKSYTKAGGSSKAELFGSLGSGHWFGCKAAPSEQSQALLFGTGRRYGGRRLQGDWAHVFGGSRCCATNSEPSCSEPDPSSSHKSPHSRARPTPIPGMVRKERKREDHRHVLHLARLGPRKRAKVLAGAPGSRLWKRGQRKAAKNAESIGGTLDTAASALPAVGPLLDGTDRALALEIVSREGYSEWSGAMPASKAPQASTTSSAVYPALAAFLALDRIQPLMLDGLETPSPDTASFYTSPQHFPVSQALKLEDNPSGGPGQSDTSPATESEDGAPLWRETAQVALPVLGLVAASVIGTLFSRRATVPRLLPRLVLPRLAMRALAYPALFLQTGMLASEKGAEKARQVALWSLPPALLVSSCFMGWRVAAASSAALLAAQLVNVDISERLPRASHWWKVALIAAAAASVVDALLFLRISSTSATGGFALSMALMGAFGKVGARRSPLSLRPALKKQAAIEMEGEVAKALPNAMFQVALDNGCQVLAHISGKIRRNRIEIYQGDRVKVEISPYDLTRGRITHRNRRTGQGPSGGQAPSGGNSSSA